MRKAIIIFVLLISCKIFAQSAATITWPLSNPANGGTGFTPLITGNVIASDELFVGTEINGYTGTNNSQRVRMKTVPVNSWPANLTKEIDTVFVQFQVTSRSGTSLKIAGLSMSICAASTSTMKASIYYSSDSTFVNRTQVEYSTGNTNNFLSSSSLTKVEVVTSVIIPDGKSFYVRIYPWNQDTAVKTGKYVCLRNVTVTGIVNDGGGNALTLVTAAITDVLHNSAICGGNVLDDGGDSVTAKGVCWNTTGSPTIMDNKTMDGTGKGLFKSSITNLSASTKYYVRAYATNSKETEYGTENSFTTSATPRLAFPTAEGYGRFTSGGRGGKVIEVTNLNDDNNPGSLRYAINQTGTRTIVFRISGTIFLKSSLSIKNGDLTIAGQTAPGDGICIAGYTSQINADNVIIRFLRFRLGDINKTEDDAFGGRNQKDIIIDHCSVSWSVDEDCSFYDNQNFTMQWCLISESLYYAGHVKGAHGYGGIWGGQGASFHHNLLAHHSSRNPRFNGSRYSKQPAKEIVDFRNNIIYNWGTSNSAYGGEGGNQNIVNNYYKPGTATGTGSVSYRILDLTNFYYDTSVRPDTVYAGNFYIDGNFVLGSSSATNDNWGVGVQKATNIIKSKSKSLMPFPYAEIKTESTEQAYNSVLKIVGANFPKRDSVDSRIIYETETGTTKFGGKYGIGKGIIDSQTDVGGWPVLNSLPAPTDSDHDGMPDDWEAKNNLNPNDADDRNNLAASGYTMLEEYMNGLISSVVTDVENEIKIPASISISQNYPNPFNPTTRLEYSLPKNEFIGINIYNIQGQLIKRVFTGEQSAGYHSFNWDGTNENGNKVGSGIYFCSFLVNNNVKTIKMTLLK